MTKKILVVDDEPSIRILLQTMLQEQGYDVHLANTGLEVLKLLDKQLIDLIIIDYNLPVIDGAKVLRTLNDKNIDIPAILISGMFGEDTENQDFPHTKSIVSKPFDVEELCEEVALYITE